MALGLTAAQLESLAMISGGIVWILVVRNRYGTLARPADQTSAAEVPAQKA